MRDITTKQDNVDVLSAAEFNSYLTELENAVTAAGITLDLPIGPDTNSQMLAQAITIAAQGGQSYQDSGTADTYVLGAIGGFEQPDAYVDGMVVLFQAGNANTGASTINVSGLGVRDLVDASGVALAADVITADAFYLAQYNAGADEFLLISFGGGGDEDNVIGVNQTWQDVLSSRLDGVTYTNSTGRPIQVFISGGRSGGVISNFTEFYLNGNIVAVWGDANVDENSVSVIVPDGDTYRMDNFPEFALNWNELR